MLANLTVQLTVFGHPFRDRDLIAFEITNKSVNFIRLPRLMLIANFITAIVLNMIYVNT